MICLLTLSNLLLLQRRNRRLLRVVYFCYQHVTNSTVVAQGKLPLEEKLGSKHTDRGYW